MKSQNIFFIMIIAVIALIISFVTARSQIPIPIRNSEPIKWYDPDTGISYNTWNDPTTGMKDIECWRNGVAGRIMLDNCWDRFHGI